MSAYRIQILGGRKMMVLVHNREEYMALRNSEHNRRAKKHKMLQMNYSVAPPNLPQGEELPIPLKGSKTPSNSVGMDIDLNEEDNENEKRSHAIRERIISKKDKLGLLMLEASATKGYHVVFRRHPEMSQEENLRWASGVLNVPFDPAAKDITRVFYTPADKLIYLDDELFSQATQRPSQSFGQLPQRGAENSTCPASAEGATDKSANPASAEGATYTSVVRKGYVSNGGNPKSAEGAAYSANPASAVGATYTSVGCQPYVSNGDKSMSAEGAAQFHTGEQRYENMPPVPGSNNVDDGKGSADALPYNMSPVPGSQTVASGNMPPVPGSDNADDGKGSADALPSNMSPVPGSQTVASGNMPPVSGSLANNNYPDDYDGIKYEVLVESLQELLGGVPAHGSRNNFIFSMAAYLRYVCDDDPDWIASVLPTYGEAKEKWRRTIESACQRAQYKTMPQIVKRAIANARKLGVSSEELGVEECEQLPPEMPKKLPRLIAHLVKNVPEVCRPAVANAVFPALAAHLKGVKFWLIDGTEKEATFMCVTMAKQSSGKSAINKPIEYIVADIIERDELSRKREQEWKDAMASKGANKEKPKRPDDLCVQVLVSDMTNAAFVQRMKDADGKYLYTNLEELDLLKQLQTNGTKDVGKIICLCFDNGKYGQERVGTQSVTARVDLRWNWNASSTIQKGIKFFSGRLVDGTLSRINFCTIIQDKSKPFVYGRYDEQYAETLKPFITNLNLANGHIECKQALQLAQQMLDKCMEDAALSDDDVLQDLAYRAVTIAYLKAMVLYIANDMTWTKEIAEFAEWSLNYDLWCKTHFFGQQITEDKAAENIKQVRGRQNLLDLLPDTFTLQQAQEVRRQQGMNDKANNMVRVWVCRGYVERDEITSVYIKTDAYQARRR